MHPYGGLVITRPDPLGFKVGQTFGLTLLSDLHFGSAAVDYGHVESELKRAADCGDRVLINGDVFDAILPKDVKRYVPSALHPRVRGRDDVLNACVDWAYEALFPYRTLIDMIGVGNHDTAVEKYHGFDPVLALVDRLNDSGGSSVAYGGYCGFVDYRFRGPSNNFRFVLFYHHGAGSGSSLSGAFGELGKFFHLVEGVHCVWLGHRHSRASAHVERLHCPESGYRPRLRQVRFVRTGSYLKPYGGMTQTEVKKHGRQGSYVSDSGYPAHGRGGARVVLTFGSRDFEVRVEQ